MTNKITTEYITNILDNCPAQEYLFHGGKSMVISYLLPNGFTVDGRAGVVDLKNFDIEIGRKVARQNAINQLFLLEGYLLQEQLKNKEESNYV